MSESTIHDPVWLSGQLLAAVKVGHPTANLEQALASITLEELGQDLSDQASRLTFWINLYNAFFQIKVKERPELAGSKFKLYTTKHFKVAGQSLSLDDIEHGLLRRSSFKWALGYMHNPFAAKFEKEFRVFEKDARIHFALNCGAKSCPPIYFYKRDEVEDQLKMATQSFLIQEAKFDESSKTLHTTMLFRFYAGDFGGTSGIKHFHQQYDIIPDTKVRLEWNKYDWTIQMDNYL